MSRRKTALGIAALFALALSAFSAASASALGTTAETCVQSPGGTLIGPHCLTEGAGDLYEHKKITTLTTGIATNTNTASGTTASRPSFLKGALSGVVTELKCGEVSGEGPLENKETGGGEMYAHAEGKLIYTKCEVTAPAGKGCKVKGEKVETLQLTGTTEKTEMLVEIKPKEGTKFADITIEGCSIAALNNTFPVTGSLKAMTNGATLTSSHEEITAQNTLKFGGVKAGLDGAITLKAHEKAGEETKPISVTTT